MACLFDAVSFGFVVRGEAQLAAEAAFVSLPANLLQNAVGHLWGDQCGVSLNGCGHSSLNGWLTKVPRTGTTVNQSAAIESNWWESGSQWRAKTSDASVLVH